MKRIFFLLVFVPQTLFSQQVSSTRRGGSANIFNDAIERYLDHYYGRMGKLQDTFYVLKRQFRADSFSERIKGFRVVIIDEADMRSLLERKRSFLAHRISPLEYDHNRFYVFVTPFSVKKRDTLINMGTWGPYAIIYSFKKRRNAFIFRKVESWQI